MRAALSRAAKKELHRAGVVPAASAHASRNDVADWRAIAPRPPRLRADRRVRQRPLSAATHVGQACHYGYDAHGNITFLTDATGAVTDSYDYDAWGTVVASVGSTPNTRLYVGEEFDPDLGLIHLRARQYKPGTGRFLTVDPVIGDRRLPITMNRYLYAGSDPINLSDPRGTIIAELVGLLKGLKPSDAAMFVFNQTIAKTAAVIGAATGNKIYKTIAVTAEVASWTALPFAMQIQGPEIFATGVIMTCMLKLFVTNDGSDRYNAQDDDACIYVP